MNDSNFTHPEGSSGAPKDMPHGEPGANGASKNQARGEVSEIQLVSRRTADELSPRYSSHSVDAVTFSGGDDNDEGIDLRALWAMIRRRKYVLLFVFLVVMSATVILTWRAQPIYQSKASILVTTSKAPSGGADELPALAEMLGGTRARSLETQIEVIKSGPILKGAMERLTPEMRALIGRYYTMAVTPVRNTDVISVVVTSYSAAAAAALADAICQEYMEQSQEQNQHQLYTARVYVQGQLATVQKRLDKARQALMRFKRENNTVDLATESSGKIERLGTAQAALNQAQAERVASEAQLERLRGLVARMAPSSVAPAAIVRRPAVEAMKEQLTRLELERLSALQEYTPQSLQVKTIEGQITAIKNRLRREAQTEVGTWQQTANPVRQSLMQDVARLQGEIWGLDARGGALRSAVAAARSELARLPQQEYKLGQLTTDVAALQQTYQMLNERYQSLRISEAAQFANARLLDGAGISKRPISPQVQRNLLMGAFLGVLLAIAMAMLVDRIDDRVHSEDDAQRASGVAVLAHVPMIKAPSSPSLLGNWQKVTPLLESYRMLRTNIEFSSVDEPIQCLAVTSTQPNEGKSTSSLNLAIVMAMDGKQVILMDADLRRPSLHRMFGLPNVIGFTNVVAGNATIEEALQDTQVPGLRILTSGPIPPNPPELLNSRAGRACIQRACEISDFLLIDCPPALVMTDARIVGSIAGAALIVIAAQEAGLQEISRTADQLRQSGTRVLGSILTKLTAETGSHYGYYGYNHPYYGAYLSEETPEGEETKKLESSKTS